MKKMTREWVGKAEDDYQHVLKTLAGSEPFHDQVCFHCQQSAEKYLKALLEELGQAVPRTHDLEYLLALLKPHHPSLRSYKRGLSFLTGFAVGTRYPMFHATKRQSVAALRWAGRVRDACRAILNIHPRQRRGKSP